MQLWVRMGVRLHIAANWGPEMGAMMKARISGATGCAEPVPVPIDDQTTRMMLVSHLVGWLEHGVIETTMPSDLVDRLRGLSVSDAMRLASGPCGLSLAVDCAGLRHQLGRVEMQRGEREQYEAFILAGASPELVARLFGVSEIQVRQRRKVIAPGRLAGGRPRLPDAVERDDVCQQWVDLLADPSLSERDRYWKLHGAFAEFAIVALEDVIRFSPGRAWLAPGNDSRFLTADR